jgi:hypothetical protein
MEPIRRNAGDPVRVASLAPEGEADRAGEAIDLATGRVRCGYSEFDCDDRRRAAVALGPGHLASDRGGEVRPRVERALGRSRGLHPGCAVRAPATARTRQELLDLFGDPMVVAVAYHEPSCPAGAERSGRRLAIVGHAVSSLEQVGCGAA